MRTIGYNAGGITRFGASWHCGRLVQVRYFIGRLVQRVTGLSADDYESLEDEPWVCRWLGLSGFSHLQD